MKSGVSVIVCCYNSQARLPETLRHLTWQKVQDVDWEIIVVDNASKDNTAVLAKQLLQNNGIPYKVVHENKPGLIHARKKGVSAAQYDKLLFCDDDNWLDENYVQTVNNVLASHSEISILGGKGIAEFEKNKPDWFDTYQQNFAVGAQGIQISGVEKVMAVYGAGTTIRTKLFNDFTQIGFESLLTGRKGNMLISGEDIELCKVAGYLDHGIAYCPNLTFKHLMTEGRMSWDYLKKLHFGFGRMRLYLHAYDHVETYHKIPGEGLRFPLWLDKYIHHAKLLLKYYPGIWFKLQKQGNDTVLKYMALKGEMFELKSLNNNYRTVFESLLSLSKRIDTFKKQRAAINKA